MCKILRNGLEFNFCLYRLQRETSKKELAFNHCLVFHDICFPVHVILTRLLYVADDGPYLGNFETIIKFSLYISQSVLDSSGMCEESEDEPNIQSLEWFRIWFLSSLTSTPQFLLYFLLPGARNCSRRYLRIMKTKNLKQFWGKRLPNYIGHYYCDTLPL